jgi:transglutaminase-like putative cysteine protease
MLHTKKICLIALLCLNLFAFDAFARTGESAPAWLTQAAAARVPAYDKDIPAVVLYDERIVNLSSDGQLTMTSNFAVRLLNREGKIFAKAAEVYLQSSSKVRDLKAWLIRPNGSVKYFDKDTIVDIIADPDDVYNEYRVKTIDAEGEADAGAIFGFQSVVEERPLFTQDIWSFQERLPTLVSRYALNLPAGWQAKSVTFNRDELKPQVSGTSYVWEMRDLAPIPPESGSPSVRNIAPRIHVNYSPATPNAAYRAFASWQDVSRWGSELHDPHAAGDDQISAKARSLTANAKTELDKIRAIAGFVQNLQYISIDIGVGRGNGYRPRPAGLVLQRGYGDCKDKANLMRAMLKTLGIEAYPVFIYSGDPTFVRQEWASPSQFNHCIIAVKVSAETNAPTVITDSKLGRLLIFDATDSYTLLGDLPDHEQGSYALVAAGENGGLIQMPILPPDANRLERQAEAVLAADGSLQGAIREQAFGQTASKYRAESRMLGAGNYKTAMEQWLTHRVVGAKMSKMTPTDKPTESRFDIDMEFSAQNYAQLMQGRLMIFKPAFVGRLDQLSVSDKKRVHPVLLDASQYSETIKVKLPAGFDVDEMPEASKLETPFGKFAVTYEIKDGNLLFHRSLTLNKTTVAADKYEAVKSFFSAVRAAEQNPVVLVKK